MPVTDLDNRHMATNISRRCFLAGVGGATAVGATPPGVTASSSTDTEPEDASEIQTFVDATVERTLDEHGATGATVSVVHDGEVAALGGYGTGFFDGSEPIDPELTPFRIGSIAKTITYTAAMQRVDRDAIDPEEDVTTYLDSVSVAEDIDEPVTLAHLATHTAGFDTGAVGITRDLDQLRPLDETLERPRPARLRPPGSLPTYTNYATALTGQVIEDETGRRFGEYVREELFEPLGMTRSTVEPPPDDTGDLADSFRSEVSDFSQVPPAGGMLSTAGDMGRFMLALLTDGATASGRILTPSATAELFEQWYTPHDALAGAGFGFWRQYRGDTVLVHHGGGIGTFRGQLLMVPALDLGVFVAYHGGGEQFGGQNAYRALEDFVDSFLERFVPVERPDIPSTGEANPDHAGVYVDLNLQETSQYTKLLGIGDSPPERVGVDDDGFLTTDGGEHRWVRTDPGVYLRADGAERLVVEETDDGTYLFRGGASLRTYRKVGRHEEPMVQAALLGASILVLLSGVVGWPVAAGWRRYRETGSPTPTSLSRARWAVGAAVGFLGLFVLGLVTLVVSGGIFWPPWWLPLVFVPPVLAAGATVVAGGYAIVAWREGSWTPIERLHYTAVVGALVAVLWLLYYWNLLGRPLI